MNRLIGLLLLCALSAIAPARAATLRVAGIGPTVAIPIERDGLQPRPGLELPPLVVPSAGLVILSTEYSWACRAAPGVLAGPGLSVGGGCALLTAPAVMAGLGPVAPTGPDTAWTYTYAGVLSALPLKDTPSTIALVLHGENKNEVINGRAVQNTVNAAVSVDDCASAAVRGVYHECFAAFHGFVSMMLADAGTGRIGLGRIRDLGPVLWPSLGYAGRPAPGIAHPTAIAAGDYLYLFYFEYGGPPGTPEGRRGGLKVARARLPISAARPPVFIPFADGGFDPRNTSLPPGFDAGRVDRFYAVPGGRSDALWSAPNHVINFAAAHLAGTPYFLGVDEDRSADSWHIRLRVSSDLVHWGAPVDVPGEQADNPEQGDLHYPVLMDASGTSNQEVDPRSFFIVGTAGQRQAMRKQLSIEIAP